MYDSQEMQYDYDPDDADGDGDWDTDYAGGLVSTGSSLRPSGPSMGDFLQSASSAHGDMIGLGGGGDDEYGNDDFNFEFDDEEIPIEVSNGGGEIISSPDKQIVNDDVVDNDNGYFHGYEEDSRSPVPLPASASASATTAASTEDHAALQLQREREMERRKREQQEQQVQVSLYEDRYALEDDMDM